MDKLKDRREELCLKFAKKCLRNSKVKSMFPSKDSNRILRNQSKHYVNFAVRERYRKSAIPFMQNLMNENDKETAKFIRSKGL